MKEELLNDLIVQTEELLLNKNQASPGTLRNYEKDGFKPIRRFFGEHGSAHYSNHLIDDCIKSAWDAHQRGIRSLHQFQVLRKAALLLQEVYETGTLQWRLLPAWATRELAGDFCSVLSDYLVSVTGTYSASTIRSKKNVIRQFLFFLDSDGVTELSKLSSKILLNYLGFISGRRPFSMRVVFPTIRSFLGYLNTQGVTRNDFTALLNMKSIYRSTIKPVFAKGESEKILSCINRTCAKGKRDYAMLMLAKHNGLRSSDILNLKLSNVDWKKAEISIIQRKTGNSLTCPLHVETGNAIADYILNARPDSKLQYIFLKLSSPYGKISSSASLCHLLKRYMSIAGVSYEPGTWKSTHTFRRTLATRMLDSEIPLTTISQVLGHKNPQSSKAYLSLSEKKLSECPLSLKGIEVTAEGLLYE